MEQDKMNEMILPEDDTAGEIVFNIDVMLAIRKMSVSELAERVGVTERRLEGWEYGEREPDIRHLIDLADALECTVDQLVRPGKGGDEGI